jgi:hypothetical protein
MPAGEADEMAKKSKKSKKAGRAGPAKSAEPKRPALSGPRARLAELIADRTGRLEEAERLRLTAERLAEAQDGVAPIEAKLTELDAAEAHAISKWARDGAAGPRPAPDIALRDKLVAELASARASAAAAGRAAAAIVAEREQKIAEAKLLDMAAAEPIAEIIADEMAPLLEEFRKEWAAIAIKRDLLALGSALMLSLAEESTDIQSRAPTLRRLERLNSELGSVGVEVSKAGIATGPLPDSAWLDLANRLRAGDARARLKVS